MPSDVGSSIDVRKLRPAELVRLLNSTPLGEVIDGRKLKRQRERAGYRIGDARTIDLPRYVAWLISQRHGEKTDHGGAETRSKNDDYEQVKERARARSLELSESGRDIGELPAVVKPRRKAKCRRNFRAFCEEYFPETFYLPWSADHLKVIAKIEQVVLEGGLYALAMPRGGGKSSLCEAACIWALVYGHRGFVVLISAEESLARQALASIKSELEHNDRLLEDFPEVVHPIRRLEGIHQRAGAQLFNGQRTLIRWRKVEIVLPNIPGSRGCGGIIRVAGITGRIRGMKFKRPDGQAVRPELVLVDDPQTDESAASLTQNAARERILAGAILGLAGPGKKIAALMPLTVIRPDDMADRVLDRKKHPDWQGERTKMVYHFPADQKHWAEYAKLLRTGLAEDRGITEATAYYKKQRRAMDAGAVVAWPERFNADELSAIQHAMNLRLRDERAFFSEYQNEPLSEIPEDAEALAADQIAAKCNSHDRRQVPLWAAHVTAFIDVHKRALYWLVAAWGPDFTGAIIDYGTWPDQRREYFSLTDCRRTLAWAAPRAGFEGSIHAGLEKCTEELIGREWPRDGGGVLRIERCLIDANWGDSRDVVYQFCRQSRFGAVLYPSHGIGIGPAHKPLNEYQRKPGDRVGLNWRIPAIRGRGSIRHAIFDANYWKSFVQARLVTKMGDAGCLSLFGRKAERHRLLADHLTAEYRVETEGRGRKVNVWQPRIKGGENHWWDCAVGAAVAASIQGAAVAGTEARPVQRKRIRFADARRRQTTTV
jgi:hypothetical protein